MIEPRIAPRPGGSAPRRAVHRVSGAVVGASAMDLAAAVTALAALAIYLRTLAPGVSFGDWAEMQSIPARLGVAHPTGYPLYILLGWLFSLVPIGDVAFRAVLLSAVSAAGAAGVAVLIAGRLGVRPLVAAALGLTLAVTNTLWEEANFSEMNSLHLLLVGLVIHRALVWRDERRDRDLRLGALLSGLAIANHLLAVTVVPIVALLVIVDARRRLLERPVLLIQCALLVVIGTALYLLIPLRALVGPRWQYGELLTWDGFSSLVTGAMFRKDMKFGSGESLSRAWRAVPDIVHQIELASTVVLVPGALIGAAVLWLRDRWAALLLGLVVVVNIYFYADYRGDLSHYLLVTWLVLVVWFAVAMEAAVALARRRLGAGVAGVEVLLLVLPLVVASGNWAQRDQSGYQAGERLSEAVFAALPRDAVLITYWDVLTTLDYSHCIEGVRPDVAIRAFDAAAKVTCDGENPPFDQVVRTRPTYALFATQSSIDILGRSYDLVPGPTFVLPYGDRFPQYGRPLYRVLPQGGG